MLLEHACLGRGRPRQEIRVVGMCAFEVIIDALDGVIDDIIRRKDCMARSIEIGVWTRYIWSAWHIKCRGLADGYKFGKEHSTRHVVDE